MTKAIATLFLAFLLFGCAAQRHRDNVAAGLLTAGTPQKAFLDVWGVPTRTRIETTDTEEKRLEFSRWGGFYGRSKTAYEIWEYPDRGVSLIFGGAVLAGWKTSRTSEELRSR